MKSDLQACKSLEDIENLLRKEENKCLNDIKEKLNVPDLLWDECLAQMQKYKEYCLNTYFKQPNPNKDHSLANVDPELYKKVVHDAKMYGINPDSINIKALDEENPNNANATAIGPSFFENTFDIYESAQISIVPCNLSSTSKEHIYEYTPLHEITHLVEIHNTREILINRTLSKYSSNNDVTESIQVMNSLSRNQEKFASFAPLIKFKKPKHAQMLYDEYMDDCMHKIQMDEKIIWNKSPADANYPDTCAEMLPWILKIQDIMAKEAKQSPIKTSKS
jgi:hypothetical protein